MALNIRGHCKKSRPRTQDGYCPLYLRVKQPHKTEILISLGKYIDPEGFDNRLGLYARHTHRINTLITQEIGLINDRLFDLRRSGLNPSAEDVKCMYVNGAVGESFISYAEGKLQTMKGTMHGPTHSDYKGRINQLKIVHPNLTFHDINTNWLEEYRSYLLNVKLRKPNGIYHDFATIKRFWNIAKNDGLVSHNPFTGFKMPKEKTEKQYLMLDELNRVYDLWRSGDLDEALQANIWYYLLSCLTSLRLSDIRAISDKMISDDNYLNKIMEKGVFEVKTSKSRFRKQTTLPVFEKLQELLSSPPNRPIKQKGSRINDDLRKVIAEAKIDKHISFHSGRHTCGVIMTQLGIDIRVIQATFTHSTVATTEIYARIVDDMRNEELSKMNGL